ncbi:hypothetical protein MMC31_006870 [Peltigera leucophlebia]|nr:hypothetical protein [Peltigera leucophlebia]
MKPNPTVLIAKTKSRDKHCVVTKRDVIDCHRAHTFPYSLGKTQERATLDIWRVLGMFWGLERRDQLQQFIFGPQDTTPSTLKTRINALYNMITLSPKVHTIWARGRFTLEPLGAEASPYELRAKLQWMPQKSESPKELGIAADPINIELIPLTIGSSLHNITGLPITDGHIVTFTINDPINGPVPHRDLLMLQCFLIRVLRMAGRAGEDMLEKFDADHEVSLLATSNAGSTEEQTADELARSPPCHNGTTDLETSPPTTSPFSSTRHLCTAHLCTAKLGRTGQAGCLPKKGSHLPSVTAPLVDSFSAYLTPI